MKVLFSWIGHADLKSLLGTEVDKQVKEIVKAPYVMPEAGGPIKTLLSQEAFDKLFLLSDNAKSVTTEYVKSLPIKVNLYHTSLKTPTNYREIYSEVAPFMESVVSNLPDDAEISILLSPGTPAMAAIWVLLGKTKYNVSFWQTWAGKAIKEEIPFDIAMDVVPELMSQADSFISGLANKSPKDVEGFEDIIGDSKAIRLAVARAQKVAVRDVPVLITGESGTGKEMFANAIHKASLRKEQPFIVINCAAIPLELIESELFGHVKGAFTGAIRARDGAFKLADGGTLFLDEVGELPLQVQSKLLRVLQPTDLRKSTTREFYPVGSMKPEKSNVRVVAATNRNLFDMISGGVFREDLYYRLAVITVKLPSLRERKSDIVKLAENLLRQINEEFAGADLNFKYKNLSASTKNFIKKYTWPGNVRELYNVILQAVVMAAKENISQKDIEEALPEITFSQHFSDDQLQDLSDGFDLDEYLKDLQIKYLRKAIDEADGQKTKAARILGIKNYQTLDARLKKFNISKESAE